MTASWPRSVVDLMAEQERLAAVCPPPWHPVGDPDTWRVGGCFVAFRRGEQGPGHAGDRCWVGAVVVRAGRTEAEVAVQGVAGAAYEPGLLALREGSSLAAALEALPVRPDVVLVDATGRDHPRRCGLAVHLGAVLDLPTIGVTHRPLLAVGTEPGPQQGSSSPLLLDDTAVGAWLRTRAGARAVAVHAGWRTDVATAVEVVSGVSGRARTPEPLRLARVVARVARACASGAGAG